MHSPRQDDPDTWPRLGRFYHWVDKPGSANKIFWALAVLCVFLFLLDFTYKKYGHFAVETIPGFYGIFGFVMFTALIFVAKTLRLFIKRPEEYYGDKAVDTEDYPDAGLEKVDYDA
jgi:hypothetical protein